MASTSDQQRRRLMAVVTAICLGLIPWTVYLASTLPRHYVASHWRFTWVGFDIALMVALALTAWRGFRREPRFPTTAVVTATLLTVDAWFDITTASKADRPVSLASALLVEVPLAILLGLAARRARRAPAQVQAEAGS
jgi:hypothetical protein